MIETVEKFLDRYALLKPKSTFMVGFSGGADSLCLLDILHIISQKYNFQIIAMHLNHNWRGEESKQEELNCKNFCERIGIEFISETLESEIRTESFARESRYNFFLKHAKNYPNSVIFTAHTRTDNAETVIYRIIKGTGIQGLQGIPEKRMLGETPLYRPLLSVSRKEIEDYCNSKGLVANTDSSNFDINYKRNFIRHKIMPLFDEINFQAEKSIDSLSKLAISHTNIVNEYIDSIMKDIYVDKKLLTKKFMELSDDVQNKIIYDACLKFNLEYDKKKVENALEFIKCNFKSKSGSRHSITNDLWLFVNSEYIYLINHTQGEKNNDEIVITEEGEYRLPVFKKTFSIQKFTEGEDFKFPKENALKAYVNLDNVGLNLTIRTRRGGDYITPFGMTGSMKLKKYLNSKCIPQHEKDGLILLTTGLSDVLWVAGVGLSNKIKVVDKPTHVIELLDKE